MTTLRFAHPTPRTTMTPTSPPKPQAASPTLVDRSRLPGYLPAIIVLLLALTTPALAYNDDDPHAGHDHPDTEASHPHPHATHGEPSTPAPAPGSTPAPGATQPLAPGAGEISPYTGTESTAEDAPAGPTAHQLHDLHHHSNAPLDRDAHAAFADRVDTRDFARLAVFDGGRPKILDTLAREELNRIYGRPQWRDAITGKRYDPVFTYFDMLFSKRYYFDKPIIRVEVLPLRQQLIQRVDLERMFAHVEADDPALHQRLTDPDRWLRWGQIAPLMVVEPAVQNLLSGQGSNLRLFEAQRAVVNSAITFDQVGARLNMVSPAEGQEHWHHLLALEDITAAEGLTVSNPEAAAAVREQFVALAHAWQQGDADGVNAALEVLVEQLPQINAATYPASFQLQVESVYNATSRFTIGFWVYLLATVALLVAFATRRRWIANTGLVLLVVGFLVHSGGIAARTILTERWPIHNQYESFIAVAWFAVLLGLVLMLVRRQWLFGAAAAALGSATLLTAHMIQIPSHEAGPVAAILATSRILYIHVNIVLASYAMIGLGFVISLFYIGVHYFGKGGGQGSNGSTGQPVNLQANPVKPDVALQSGAPNLLQFAAAGVGAFDRSDATPARGRLALLNDLDKAQLIVLQLAFWTLGVGILLGAYWADHAWGRWWAWDPKETWALITWIVYLVAIHVRLGVKNRGLVTAWLSVLGFFAMVWCYFGVNLLLAGLHSYA
ncbi:cytochrome c biogenesis protein CcsA [Phycisphaerales bacterium AB-hyl4]|uniref:Cytochrome c biogenesis protein CcsA n=1 Tax=Natronomicrosphaera hydrolytica TaxID=3242702 RepID=A0ABV4U9T1_9BACT